MQIVNIEECGPSFFKNLFTVMGNSLSNFTMRIAKQHQIFEKKIAQELVLNIARKLAFKFHYADSWTTSDFLKRLRKN
jgi:hypothetical protein